MLLGDARCLADLGAEVVPGVHEAELRHLQRSEWATSADDVLWRRSKLGLHLTPAQRDAVAHWMATQRPIDTAPATGAPHLRHEDLRA